jgi:sugar/nucleoside kinase (ribokinase family)
MAVVTIGEIVVDWISTAKGAGFDEAGNFWRCLGGNSTNVAVGLARLGTKARLIAKVGGDIHGRYLQEQLRKEGVELQFLLSDPRYPTAQCYCFHEADDDYTYYNWPQPNAAHMLAAEDVDSGSFAGAWCLHSSGISMTHEPRRSAVMHAMQAAKENGLLVSYDACFPTDEDEESRMVALQAVEAADLLKVNLQELIYWSQSKHAKGAVDLSFHTTQLAPPDLIMEQARSLFSQFKPLVLLVTLGCAGSVIITDKYEVFCPPIAVDTVAPVGAGDAYVAGIIHAIEGRLGEPSADSIEALAESDWHEIGRFANAVGALTTTRIGSSEGLPHSFEVAAVLKVK